jgi:glycosyltransferase involved in cell wall biosynthesis
MAAQYDVIDANEGDLPASKAKLGFQGLLVARSNGLRSYYRTWERDARRRWPDDVGRYRSARLIRAFRAAIDDRSATRAHQNADLVFVLNQTEYDTILAERLRAECVIVPHGLTQRYLTAVAQQAKQHHHRLAQSTVCCIGTWDKRKGARDWPAIVCAVLDQVPTAQFRFLGTGLSTEAVRSAIGPLATRANISVVPRFDPQDLPRLLASATVGALPSYMEGFGLAVLEMLAAGIPCVVYDSPGTRASGEPLSDDYHINPGDTVAFARQLARVLTLEDAHYATLAHAGRKFAEQRTWDDVARMTLASYSEGLAQLGHSRPSARAVRN